MIQLQVNAALTESVNVPRPVAALAEPTGARVPFEVAVEQKLVGLMVGAEPTVWGKWCFRRWFPTDLTP